MISGARQSASAHALWRSLAREHRLACVTLAARKLAYLPYLPPEIPVPVREELGTRMILFGRGWDRERLATAAGMVPAHGPVERSGGWLRRPGWRP